MATRGLVFFIGFSFVVGTYGLLSKTVYSPVNIIVTINVKRETPKFIVKSKSPHTK